MNIAQGGFKIEVFILFFRGDSNIATGCQAPVIGLQLLLPYQFYQPFHIAELSIREAYLQPLCLFEKVSRLL